ncbi:MAG: tRNA (adenosine(37)-N6)-threonylcarbamoyltransferase complex dimerization subunit type 1 TsaB [Prevotellaceae bacterium]|nr:tRNA (adenosine(37)-N6)-threonylcarbamoyltransferase complex dimerization subunit type 1 TsaB [Prevotellaceae bacterium]
MPNILHIESSTTVCSVALSAGGVAVCTREEFEGASHATRLPVFIEETLNFARANNVIPDAVAVSAGPGSYTGLRIGVASAKGVCFGWDIPLIAIPTLLIIATAAAQEADTDMLIRPMIDARRMEVYTALYDHNLTELEPARPLIIDRETWHDRLEQTRTVFCGNGAEKCKGIINAQNALFLDNIVPLSVNMIAEAERRLAAGQTEDCACFEPFYMKEFQATTPKNKIIHLY